MIVTVVIAAVNIWAAIKIKFAPDKATLIREMKTTLWKVLMWGTNCLCAANIIWFFIFWPVDRLFMFVVIYNAFALFNTYLLTVFINPLLKRESKIIDALGTLGERDVLIIDRVAKLESP